jgi:surface antigen
MRLTTKAVLLIFAGFCGGPAQAQLLGPGWETNITLKQEDLDMIHRLVIQQIHGKPVGTTGNWSNPNTGNAGSVKLVKKYQSKNRQCEQLEYTLRSLTRPVAPEHYTFNSCLQPDGTWKIS